MKYLKLYESNQDYYTVCQEYEWDNNIKKSIDFTNNEIIELKEVLKEYTFGPNGDKFLFISKRIAATRRAPTKDPPISKHIFTIIKCKDEWFYIAALNDSSDYSLRYFKCDQFTGLLECIKSEIITSNWIKLNLKIK